MLQETGSWDSQMSIWVYNGSSDNMASRTIKQIAVLTFFQAYSQNQGNATTYIPPDHG